MHAMFFVLPAAGCCWLLAPQLSRSTARTTVCLLPRPASLPDLPELTPPTVEARLQQQVEGLRQAVEAANAVLQARVAALASELVSVKTSVAAAVASASATGSNSGGSVGAAALSLLQEQAAAAAAREHPVQPASVEEALQPAPAELQQSGSVVG